jgi:two-component system nitrate/nitrite response regulator NarL
MEFGNHRIRVLVAEDNRDLAAAICALIAAEPDMQVDGIVDRAGDLLEAAANSEVLVLDLDLGGESSVPAMTQLHRSHPGMAIVVYSGYDQCDLGAALAQMDRCHYVAKTGDPDELLGAIRRAAKAAAISGS